MNLVTIVVPTCNSFGKMEGTFASLAAAHEDPRVHIVFVDDCSSDETLEQLQVFASGFERCTVSQLPANSGSAAAPRNRGIELANSDYVFFLDSDDTLAVPNFFAALDLLEESAPDILRAPLRRQESSGHATVMDRIPEFGPALSYSQKVRLVVRHQSLTACCFFKLDHIRQSELRFDHNRRIGEDITFTAQAMAAGESLDYLDLPLFTYHINNGAESVTQSINSRQFVDFLEAWEDVEQILAPQQVSFLQEHGHSAVQYALRQYVWFRSEPMDPALYPIVASFFDRHREVVSMFPMPRRFQEIAEAAASGSLEEFNAAATQRLLVAGHDLKFMSSLLPQLKNQYSVRIDEWTSHTGHDEEASLELLTWADIVWAEWLLGAAVWYSQHIEPRHRMLVRAHRSEMTVPYGDSLAIDRVDALVAVSPHCLRDFADRFDFPSSKMYLIPIDFDIDGYKRGTDPERVFRLAMVGALPRLKGLHRALALLAELRHHDARFTLTIYGKSPEELKWLWSQPSEREYYEACEEYIKANELADHVTWGGWIDPREQLADHGIVLSMSDVEGMQVAPGEAFCAGGVGMFLPWRGVEDIYPSEFIYANILGMAEGIIGLTQDGALDAASASGRDFLRKAYSSHIAWDAYGDLLRKMRA